MKFIVAVLLLGACRGPTGSTGSQGLQGIQGQSGVPTPSAECSVTPVSDGVLISCQNGTLLHVSSHGCY